MISKKNYRIFMEKIIVISLNYRNHSLLIRIKIFARRIEINKTCVIYHRSNNNTRAQNVYARRFRFYYGKMMLSRRMITSHFVILGTSMAHKRVVKLSNLFYNEMSASLKRSRKLNKVISRGEVEQK